MAAEIWPPIRLSEDEMIARKKVCAMITSGSNAVSGEATMSCRSLTIAGVSGFIALRASQSSADNSDAVKIGSGLSRVVATQYLAKRPCHVVRLQSQE